MFIIQNQKILLYHKKIQFRKFLPVDIDFIRYILCMKSGGKVMRHFTTLKLYKNKNK